LAKGGFCLKSFVVSSDKFLVWWIVKEGDFWGIGEGDDGVLEVEVFKRRRVFVVEHCLEDVDRFLKRLARKENEECPVFWGR
jgi:hypothetical protein